MNHPRVAAVVALAWVSSACLDLTGLPPLSTDDARGVLTEFCGCDRLAILKLTDTCNAIVKQMPDDSATVALAAGDCSDCFGNFEACWSALTNPTTAELCSGQADLGAPGAVCALDSNCDAETCVGGTCAGCEAGLPNGSVCRSPRECASGACELDMETVSLMPGASHSGRCSDACSGCIDENQAPSEGVCLDAALAAREVAECLCEPKDFPDNCRGENACRVPVSEGAALAKDCVTRLFEATDTACLDCLLGVRAGKCDTAIRACDGSPAQPQPQDGG